MWSVQRFCKKCGTDLAGKGFGRVWILGCCGIAHDRQRLEYSGEVRVVRQPFLARNPTASIGLHLMAEENASVSRGSLVSEFRRYVEVWLSEKP